MGLDMYLLRTDKSNLNNDDDNLCDIGYWRKANQIHKWFVDNVQDGIDDCEYYEVSKDKLGELLKVCKEVLDYSELIDGETKEAHVLKQINGHACIVNEMYVEKVIKDSSKAKELLPTQEGFFFGGVEYDEWYLQDIKDTIEIIQQVFEETDFETEKIVYTSSW